MTDALIGHTGFVGSTLLRARPFEACFNSKTIGAIDGRHFGLVVCCGVSAVKWLANQEPAADIAAIEGLMSHLATITAEHFVLISPVEVYRDPVGVTEVDRPPTAGLHAYGLHRLRLEEWVISRFAPATIVRLPGLFGQGLRKNLIHDLLNGVMTDKINAAGVLQWYPMRRFAADLDSIIKASPALINVAVQPVRTEAIRAACFPSMSIGPATSPAPNYDMRTSLPGILGGRGAYHITADAMMAELGAYISGERRATR